MEIPSYFDDFLPKIGPTKRQKAVMVREHNVLRDRLMADPKLKDLLLATFIQGSQRRFTANRGSKTHPCDVDVVAVTNMVRSATTAANAHRAFQPFLEQHYAGRYTPQDRSWCITVDEEVTIDLVPTSEPGSPALLEAVRTKSLRDWDAEPGSSPTGPPRLRSLTEAILEDARRDQEFEKSEPLWIPDRALRIWEETHPLYLIGWTARKNQATEGHFIHTVRIIKWWRREVEPLPKYPKGYSLEHMVGDCCPDHIKSVAAGVADSLTEMANRYARLAAQKATPFLPARGVTDPEINVLRRVSGDDFAGFHSRLVIAAELARRALGAATVRESAELWGQLLGSEFPQAPKEESRVAGGFTPPSGPARPQESRFA